MIDSQDQNSRGITFASNLVDLRAQKASLLDNELVLLPALSCTEAVVSEISKPRPLDIWLETFLPEDGYNWSITTDPSSTYRPGTLQCAHELTSASYKAALFFNSFRQSDPSTSNCYSASIEKMEAICQRASKNDCYAATILAELINISHPSAYVSLEKFVFLSAKTDGFLLNLTPKIHTDRDYGPFESAIASFSSATTIRTGTITYPLARIENDMDLSDWFKSKRFGRLARSSIPYSARNGEPIVFSGRQSLYHLKDEPPGLPHISPELTAGDFRLVLLCRICYSSTQ